MPRLSSPENVQWVCNLWFEEGRTPYRNKCSHEKIFLLASHALSCNIELAESVCLWVNDEMKAKCDTGCFSTSGCASGVGCDAGCLDGLSTNLCFFLKKRWKTKTKVVEKEWTFATSTRLLSTWTHQTSPKTIIIPLVIFLIRTIFLFSLFSSSSYNWENIYRVLFVHYTRKRLRDEKSHLDFLRIKVKWRDGRAQFALSNKHVLRLAGVSSKRPT